MYGDGMEMLLRAHIAYYDETFDLRIVFADDVNLRNTIFYVKYVD